VAAWARCLGATVLRLPRGSVHPRRRTRPIVAATATARCAPDFVVNVSQLELHSSDSCVSRSLLFCHFGHLSRGVMRNPEAIELLGVALQLKLMVTRERQCRKLRGKRRTSLM